MTGYNFDHRRRWLEKRILALSEVFAVDLFGYAVMSNHYHMVLQLVPNRTDSWSDEDIVDRWMSLCSPSNLQREGVKSQQRLGLLQDAERLKVLRNRLGSLSWLMRFINEPLARIANKEDDCKGRFWEGRFKSQRLLDANAVLAAMVYVDLNPIRAGLTDDVAHPPHTSLNKRQTDPQKAKPMTALNGPYAPLPFNYTVTDYLDLAEWTVEAQQQKRPTRSNRGPPQNTDLWLDHYLPKPGYWQRACGSFESLQDYAKSLGQSWIKTRSLHLRP
jgi:hypothetical protein